MDLEMRQMKPKTGDLVRLRSGGPIMTAERVFSEVPEPYVRCAWFDARELAHGASFKTEALEFVQSEETEPR
jgi:uncharacterized protein YodC (DUF2158 family)